jgi:DNA-binding GntR family transcriptional regulator
LSRTPWTITQEPLQPNPEALKAHRELHRSLIAACGSTVLLDFADSLFEQADRYRVLSQRSESAAKRDVDAEHRALVEATLARDTPRAIRLTIEHVQRTTELVKEAAGSADLRAV